MSRRVCIAEARLEAHPLGKSFTAEVKAAAVREGAFWCLPFDAITALLKQHQPVGQIGLGDAVERVTTLTGVKRLFGAWEKKTGRKCGCGRRKAWLNRWKAPRWLAVILGLSPRQDRPLKVG